MDAHAVVRLQLLQIARIMIHRERGVRRACSLHTVFEDRFQVVRKVVENIPVEEKLERFTRLVVG
ncbi:hypothetical protein D9M70_595600 [compost metagenome]